jgi:hypothetical protein
VTDPLEQQGAVHNVVAALRYRYGAQVAGDHLVVGGGRVAQHALRGRLVAIDGGDRDLEPARGEPGEAELAQRGQAARLEHADRASQALQHMIAHRLGEEAGRRPVAARRAALGSRHAAIVNE